MGEGRAGAAHETAPTPGAVPELHLPGPGIAPGGGTADPAVSLEQDIDSFHDFGTPTRRFEAHVPRRGRAAASVPVFVNEYWTARQRAASRLHEVPYRACFKPQLPRFFIERLTAPGEVVYDPFMGRGTTPLEAALLGRIPWGCDMNPLGTILLTPRLAPPRPAAVAARLHRIDWDATTEIPDELLVFYHPATLGHIVALRGYLAARQQDGTLDDIDRWIRMVALTRLTGHSPGFLSVYTLPPNQAVSVVSQKKINAARQQVPPRREIVPLILRKSNALLAGLGSGPRRRLAQAARGARLITGNSECTPELPSGSVHLVVTSPPFLNVVDYVGDNWLRAWFCGIELDTLPLTVPRRIEPWKAAMTRTFTELRRLLVPAGQIAFEVGEVNLGRVALEETVCASADAAGLEVRLILINDQEFTKTSHCWGVSNRKRGTNTNRIVLLREQG
ncbi:MAG: DNA methyltransferase [Thermoplasmata archaeon]